MDVLVIDDEEGIPRFVSRILGQVSRETVAACDGRATLELIRARRFDLVITDLNPPRRRDVESLVPPCKSDPGAPVRLIAITGGNDDVSGRTRAAAIARHIDATPTKPFRRAEFVACLNDVMRGDGRARVSGAG